MDMSPVVESNFPMVQQPGNFGFIYSFVLVSFIYFLRYSNAMFWSWVNFPLFQILLPYFIIIGAFGTESEMQNLRSRNDF